VRAALEAAMGITAVVRKRRHLLEWQGVRIHLDDVDLLGRWVEIEAPVSEGSDIGTAHGRAAELRHALGLDGTAVVAQGYAQMVAAADGAARTAELVARAREAMANAWVPYSGFAVGAALRDERGIVHAGANVENAAHPQGQCAEASALGVLVTAGGRAISEIAVMADADLITPCGGCRQRLAELAHSEVPVHLCGPEGIRRTLTLGELLPLAFDLSEGALG
jgi:homotetrameric cytidine deaminase